MAIKKCPYCAENIQSEAIFCRFCRHDLTKDIIQEKTIKCPYCAEYIPYNTNVCSICGHQINPRKLEGTIVSKTEKTVFSSIEKEENSKEILQKDSKNDDHTETRKNNSSKKGATKNDIIKILDRNLNNMVSPSKAEVISYRFSDIDKNEVQKLLSKIIRFNKIPDSIGLILGFVDITDFNIGKSDIFFTDKGFGFFYIDGFVLFKYTDIEKTIISKDDDNRLFLKIEGEYSYSKKHKPIFRPILFSTFYNLNIIKDTIDEIVNLYPKTTEDIDQESNDQQIIKVNLADGETNNYTYKETTTYNSLTSQSITEITEPKERIKSSSEESDDEISTRDNSLTYNEKNNDINKELTGSELNLSSEEKTRKIIKLIDENISKICSYRSVYNSNEVVEKSRLIDNYQKRNNIRALGDPIGFIDTSFFENGKTGILFTTDGISFTIVLSGSVYFNYIDITKMIVIGDNLVFHGEYDHSKGPFELTDLPSISSGAVKIKILKSTIEQIIYVLDDKGHKYNKTVDDISVTAAFARMFKSETINNDTNTQ